MCAFDGRRRRAIALLSLLVACAGAGADETEGPESRPSFLLIVADDLGYGDLGCYDPTGRSTRASTPHLDRLAAGGMRFTDFHSNGSMCTPTRAALLTGRYQNRLGRDFEGPLSARGDQHLGLPLEAVTIAEALKRAGYATAMYGKWHLGFRAPFLPTRQGFDEFRGLVSGDGDHHSHINRSGDEDWWRGEKIDMERGYTTDLLTRHAVDFVERHRDRPFFVYVAHLAIHFPWQGPGESAHRVRGRDYWNPTKLGPHGEGEVGPVVRAMIESLDRSVGRLVAALRRLGLDRRTLVFFTSDNGGYLSYGGRFRGEISSNGPLRGQKGTLFEGGIRVPAIASWPGRIEPGSVSRETAMTMDLMPTFLELAGVAPDRDGAVKLDGASLAGHLLRREPLPARTLFWRDGDERAVRRGSWKLVSRQSETLLFDLDTDRGETRDRSGEKPALVEALRADLERWEREVTPVSAGR